MIEEERRVSVKAWKSAEALSRCTAITGGANCGCARLFCYLIGEICGGPGRVVILQCWPRQTLDPDLDVIGDVIRVATIRRQYDVNCRPKQEE